MNIYKAALGDDKEFSKITLMKKYLGMSDEEIKQNFKNLIDEKMFTELADYYGGQVAEKKGIAGYEPNLKFRADVEAEQKKEAGGEDAEGSDDGEDGSELSKEGEDESAGDEETNAESPEEDIEEPKKEAPEPTFGLS